MIVRQLSAGHVVVHRHARAARQEHLQPLAQSIERRGVRAFLGRHMLRDGIALAIDDVDQAWLADGHVHHIALRVEPDRIWLATDWHAGDFPIAREIQHAARLQVDKELVALQRRFRKVVARDYVGAPARPAAAQAIDRSLVFGQGISPKLTPVTDTGDLP
jgi:hypothetical protein